MVHCANSPLAGSVSGPVAGILIRVRCTDSMKRMASIVISLISALTIALEAAFAQQPPMTGYAPVNGLRMYYEVRGRGEPVVLLHGAFMTISNSWNCT